MPPVHVVIITHTPERLRRTLLGLASQRRPADSIVLSCDGDDPAIVDAARDACREFAISLTMVMRARHEQSRSSQVRNNAVRQIRAAGAGRDDRLVFIDGDIVLSGDALRRHEQRGTQSPLVLAWRYELTDTQTAAFDEAAVRDGGSPAAMTETQIAQLDHRQRRFVRQARLRRLRLAKPHKPKLLSANFSVTFGVFADVNGFDEAYQGWGQEDDDLGRRIYQAGHRPVLALNEIIAWHQYHLSRAPQKLSACPNMQRLERPAPTRCPRGLDDPMEQNEVRVLDIS